MMSDYWPGWGAAPFYGRLLGATSCANRKPGASAGAKIVTQHLTRHLPEAGVERHFGIGSTFLADAAPRAGDLDVYVEHCGEAVAGEWFGPLGFVNSPVQAIANGNAVMPGIRTLTRAAGRTEAWELEFPPAFRNRPGVPPSLARRYRIDINGPARTLKSGKPCGDPGSGTAPAPASSAWLEDNQHAFPPYEAGIEVRAEAMRQLPGLAGALSALSGRLAAGQMRARNRRVEIEGAAAGRVASDFLKGAGL